jgi:competence/damage-inducible protein CinA-like protein
MSRDNPIAEIVAIGTEILLGEITDTNSVFLAQELRDLGINVYFMTSVGDNVERIAEAIRIALKRADIVITCGGLGPTVDDVTRQGIAVATNRELAFDNRLYEQIEARFRSFGVVMPENNRRQAYLPSGATAIENPVGTAPAFLTPCENDKVIVTLPGVPRELKYLMETSVIPFLMQTYTLGLIRARILRVAGVGESALDEMLGADILESANPSVGLAAHHGVIDVRITAKGASSAEVDAMLDAMEAQVRAKVGKYVYGYGKERIEDVSISFLQERRQKVAVLEAGIEDGILKKVERHVGYASVVVHAERFESPDALAVAYPREPEEGLQAHARRIAQSIAQGVGFGVVVVCEPNVDEGQDTVEASTVAVSDGTRTSARSYGFGGRSELSRTWLSRWGLARLWLMARGE